MDDPNIYSVHSVVFIFWTSTSVFFFYRKPILFFNKNTTDNDGILFVVFFFFWLFRRWVCTFTRAGGDGRKRVWKNKRCKIDGFIRFYVFYIIDETQPVCLAKRRSRVVVVVGFILTSKRLYGFPMLVCDTATAGGGEGGGGQRKEQISGRLLMVNLAMIVGVRGVWKKK